MNLIQIKQYLKDFFKLKKIEYLYDLSRCWSRLSRDQQRHNLSGK